MFMGGVCVQYFTTPCGSDHAMKMVEFRVNDELERDLERSSYRLINVYCGIYLAGLPSYICPQSTGGLATVPTRPTEGCHIRQLSSG